MVHGQIKLVRLNGDEMENTLQGLRDKVSARFDSIAKSNLLQSDKTFLERLTMQGGIEHWSQKDQRRYEMVASLFLQER
jgi:hypothetical protein